jgi:hypothetical protein
LSDNNWICSIITISTPTELAKYLELWDIIQSVTLVHEKPDSISWTLTSDVTYSASSAYKAQFFGGHARFLATKIWAAHTEPKCKLFGWLALHGKLLTADMLPLGAGHMTLYVLYVYRRPRWPTISAKIAPSLWPFGTE